MTSKNLLHSRISAVAVTGLLGILLGTSVPAVAQTTDLTPAQRQLLNQLPASQREAALRQLRQLSIPPASATTEAAPAAPPAQADPSALDIIEFAEQRPSRFESGDTLVISARAAMESKIRSAELIRQNNPYVLNGDGLVDIPGVGELNLAGLTEREAVIRLQSEPALRGISFGVVLLPVRPTGADALRPFGYELFKGDRVTQAQDLATPVPADYTIGPGDIIRVQLFGNENAGYELTVEREGTILFPELGPLAVAGMGFGQLREFIGQRVEKQLIGTQVSVSMGALRSVQVFLVGDVNSPGSYTVGALSTMTTVLAQGGGVAENGSLRRIQLKRGGKRVGVLDVYDLLLRGDSSKDFRVQAGDVVFVPPVGTRVAVTGEVKRPAIYEYKGAANVADVVNLAGGLSARAFATGTKIERLVPESGLATIDASLGDSSGREIKVQDGDTIHVPASLERMGGSVSIVGNVERPGNHEWRQGLRVSQVVPDADYVKPGSDLHYVLIRRQESPNDLPSFFSVDLELAWRMRDGPVDLTLQAGDQIHVFDLDAGRTQYLAPIIDELRRRANADKPLQTVRVGGSVNAGGEVPLEQGMRISDLVRAGGGLAQSAFRGEAELTRSTTAGGVRTTSIVTVDLDSALSGDDGANLVLQPFDTLIIREVSEWRDQEFVELVGEFAFPGRYSIRRGEKLSSVIARAGGLTDLAFLRGSVFTRTELRAREREQIEGLVARVEADLAGLALSNAESAEAAATGQVLLRQLQNADPVGRLVIDMQEVVDGSLENDILLKDGDVLRVPRRPQSVMVLGEVQYATSHVFDPGLSRNDYIGRSGGVTARADKRRIYIVRASGEVLVSDASRFFARRNGTNIEPGDTIVVPLDTDRTKPLTLWTGVTQVIYNLAIAVAAVNSF